MTRTKPQSLTQRAKPVKQPANLLDLISYVMDAPSRRLDGAVIAHLHTGWAGPDALRKGARSAHFEFMYTASTLVGREWVFDDTFNATVEVRPFHKSEEAHSFIQTCLLEPKNLTKQPTFRQYLLQLPDEDLLVTIADHSVADLTSLFHWIRHQLNVARGQPPNLQPKTFSPPVLRAHDSPTRKNSNAHAGPSTNLWRKTKRCSHRRAFESIIIQKTHFQSFLAQHQEFTYNDLLCAAALKAARQWNQKHSSSTKKLSIWMPINIRQQAFDGFGNGSSRIRVYADQADSFQLANLSRNIRDQVRTAKKEGEWFVPSSLKIEALPDSILFPFLRRYFSRPWVDMGTLPFSHLEKIAPDEHAGDFEKVIGFEVVGSLHHRHPMGITAITHKSKTTFTCTYDPAQLSQSDVQDFLSLITEALREAED